MFKRKTALEKLKSKITFAIEAEVCVDVPDDIILEVRTDLIANYALDAILEDYALVPKIK